MIQIQNLKKRYGSKVLFDGIQFHLRPGDRVALVGENGMGKTTLFRILTGSVSADEGEVSLRKGARAALLEQELHESDEAILQRVVLGDPHFGDVQREMKRLEADTEFHNSKPEEWSNRYGHLQHEFERLGGYERESKAKTILSGLAFKPHQFELPLSSFSGGWRMRVELARLLLQNPDVLLLDEPTNHLDLRSVEWLESFLKTYEGSLLLISHDRRFLNNLVGRVIELDRGTLTEYTGNYDDFERLKSERIAQLESQAANQQRKVAEVERFIERFRAKNTKATQVQSRIKMLDKMERVTTHSGTKSIRFRFPQPGRVGRIVTEAVGLSKSYGATLVYQDFDIHVERGMKIALVGENGAGKSTLLKLLAGNIEPDAGEVRLGHNVSRAYFAQHQADTLNPAHTVLDSLIEVAPRLTNTALRSILGTFLFSGDDADKKVGVLSGGERSRLALARMLAKPAPLLLLDEPTNHLDIRSCEMLAAALADFEGTLITISHDRYFLDGIINHVWEVDGGTVKDYPGNYSEYEWKKSREVPARPTGEQQQDTAPTRAKKDKDRKRREAEARNTRYRKLKPLKERLKQIEQKLETVLQGKQDLEVQLADPGIYQEDNKASLQGLLARQKELQKEESKLMTEWDDLHTKIAIVDKPCE